MNILKIKKGPIHGRSHKKKEEDKVRSLENLTFNVTNVKSIAILLVNAEERKINSKKKKKKDLLKNKMSMRTRMMMRMHYSW